MAVRTRVTSSPWALKVTQALSIIVSNTALAKKPPKNFILKYSSINKIKLRISQQHTLSADAIQFEKVKHLLE